MNATLTYPKDAPTQAMPAVVRRPTLAEELFVLGTARHASRRRSHKVTRFALVVGMLPFALACGLIIICMVVAVFPGLLLIGAGQ